MYVRYKTRKSPSKLMSLKMEAIVSTNSKLYCSINGDGRTPILVPLWLFVSTFHADIKPNCACKTFIFQRLYGVRLMVVISKGRICRDPQSNIQNRHL